DARAPFERAGAAASELVEQPLDQLVLDEALVGARAAALEALERAIDDSLFRKRVNHPAAPHAPQDGAAALVVGFLAQRVQIRQRVLVVAAELVADILAGRVAAPGDLEHVANVGHARRLSDA